jgi:hypothetical protein
MDKMPKSKEANISAKQALFKHINDRKPITKGQLWYYLAGLIEGDGSLNLVNSDRLLKGNTRGLMIRISFNSKDRPLADKLIEILGYGKVYEDINTNCISLTFQSKAQIYNIIVNLNGKMRTDKVYKL